MSYATTRPERAVTVRASRSTDSAGSPTYSSMPCFSMKPASTIDRSSGVFPEKYEVSCTRS
ncbi:hypothetical protein STANM309S_02091 [Streptomyces tanashiensis]